MSTSRRNVLALGLAPLFIRHARAADEARFALGIASGHPRADRVVLWTRVVGADLPEQVNVQWELAHDEAFTKIAARGTEVAEAAWAHSVHAEPQGLAPGRWYWYRFSALGQRSAVGRTRTAPAADAAATLRFSIASCQRYDHNRYAAWRHMATQELDLVLFLGDYIYEYASPPKALRHHSGTTALSIDDYRARYAQYKTDPALQAAHAMAPWVTLWDDHEVENDYAGDVPQSGPDPLFTRRRAFAVQAYWEHMPFPKAMRPRGTAMRLFERYDWGTLARIHTLDGRAYRDEQVCKRFGSSRSNTVALKDCPAMLDAQRSLPGLEQERWLAKGWDTQRPWNLLAQQTLMARLSWTDPAQGGGTYWNDGWDGYAPSRQRVLQGVAERKLPGAVVLGGDVHAHYVADLKVDYDKPKARTVATEFCGTSIASHGMAQARVDAAMPFNPHVRYARSDQRGYVSFTLGAKRLDAQLLAVLDARDPSSEVTVAARFGVELGAPGAQPG